MGTVGVGARVVAVLAVLAVAGCTGPVAEPEPGTEQAAPTTSAVVPAPELGPGTLVEAHRIAGATTMPDTLFPERTDLCTPRGPLVLPGPIHGSYFAPDVSVTEIFERHGFVASWGQCRRADEGMATQVLVVELSDPDSARRAAEELHTATLSDRDREVALDGVEIPVRVGPLIDGGEAAKVFLAEGRMLAYVYHTSPVGSAVPELERVVADQRGLLAAFVPTPQAQVPALSVDPIGIQDLAAKLPGEIDFYSGPYDLESYLRLTLDPLAAREALRANGFAGVFHRATTEGELSRSVTVARFPTSRETNAAYTSFAEAEAAAVPQAVPIRSAAIPEAPCFAFPRDFDRGWYQRCYVGFGSHLAAVDIAGVAQADDVTEMDTVLVAQRDLIATG